MWYYKFYLLIVCKYINEMKYLLFQHITFMALVNTESGIGVINAFISHLPESFKSYYYYILFGVPRPPKN